MSKKDECIIGHGGKTDGWLTVLPNMMNGSILSDLEFRDEYIVTVAKPNAILSMLSTVSEGGWS